jgi:toxin FitB
MFLVDTNVISENRKGSRANREAATFLREAENDLFLPVQVIGELLSGVEGLRKRGDQMQATSLDAWLRQIVEKFAPRILSFDLECARVWGRLRGGSDQNQIDKQIAAIALVYDLTLATRNVSHYAETGVRLLNPFLPTPPSGKPEA